MDGKGMNTGLRKEFENLGLGEHLCCIYNNSEERFSVVAPFMAIGFERNEKCIYIVDESTQEEVVLALKRSSIDIDRCLRQNQCQFLTKEDAYLKDGYFDPDRMIEMLRAAEKQALKEGYGGLRVTGEMTWVFTKLPGVERLMEYEAKLNYFFPKSRSTAVCQYNENKFTPEVLMDVIRVHPTIIINGSICPNPYFVPPDEYLERMKGRVLKATYERTKADIIRRAEFELERRKILEALRTSELKYKTLYDTSADAIMLVSPEEGFLGGNKATIKMFGCADEGEFISKSPAILSPEYQPDASPSAGKAREMMAIAMEKGLHYFEWKHKRSDGTEFFATVLLSRIEIEGKKLLLATVRDVSDLKRREEELKKKIRDLEIFHKAAINREMKIIELKKRIKALEESDNKDANA